jgi:hypothetical protein
VARSTLDADIIADIRQEQVVALIAALGADFYADEEMISGAMSKFLPPIQNRRLISLLPRIISLLNSNGTAWATKSRTGSGGIFWGC